MQDHDLLIRIDEKVEALYKAVMGDEQPGLVQRVSLLERWQSKINGGLILISIAYTTLTGFFLKHIFGAK